MTHIWGRLLELQGKKIKLAGKFGANYKKACIKQAFDTISGISFDLRRVVR